MLEESKPPDEDSEDRFWGKYSRDNVMPNPDDRVLGEPPPEEPLPDSQPDSVFALDATSAPTTAPRGASKESGDSEENTPDLGGDKDDRWDSRPPPRLAKGVVLDDYQLQERIGVGGMGEVWLVTRLDLQRESALKLIRPEIARNERAWQRFDKEARLAAQIEHDNAVRIYHRGQSHSMAFIEMEFVRGQSLDKFLKEREGKPLSPEWAAQVLDQLCKVLEVAHEHKNKKGNARPIIHRDLKPSNLMLVNNKPAGKNLKVLDFGIAKMIQDDTNVELTGKEEFLGTPAYMSPEQIRHGTNKKGKEEIDGRSDLYSTGVMLYEFLTGVHPFEGLDRMAMIAAHLTQKPRRMMEANGHVRVPRKVERVVMWCLEKDPDRRPQSARELNELFQAAVYGGTGSWIQWRLIAAIVVFACLLGGGSRRVRESANSSNVRRFQVRPLSPRPEQ